MIRAEIPGQSTNRVTARAERRPVGGVAPPFEALDDPLAETANARNAASLNIVIAIATTRRPQIVAGMLGFITRQTLPPHRVIVAIAEPSDIDPDNLPIPAEIILADRGCCRQRNAVLELVDRDDLVIFIDDDFLIAPDFCERVHALFAERPSVVMATGHVLADGINGPGYDFATAEGHLARARPVARPKVQPIYNCYGCNMVIRASTALDHGLRFDERLPLYGWLEDLDFSRRMAAHGEIVISDSLQGVHMGTKTWRTPGVKLGYSQIANPAYLVAKGTMSLPRALRIMLRNLAMNLLRAPRPEPWVDRRGRLRGNLLAMRDVLTGKLEPERAESAT